MAEKTENERLTEAKSNKKDEYYTQLTDIERELKYYKQHYKNKFIYCNCDDPLTRKERFLSIRGFADNQKREAYERQKGICPVCTAHYDISEMEGDHITP